MDHKYTFDEEARFEFPFLSGVDGEDDDDNAGGNLGFVASLTTDTKERALGQRKSVSHWDNFVSADSRTEYEWKKICQLTLCPLLLSLSLFLLS